MSGQPALSVSDGLGRQTVMSVLRVESCAFVTVNLHCHGSQHLTRCSEYARANAAQAKSSMVQPSL